ncbi:DUF1028 domain-containing protein [Vibrio sp. Isolate31]|uniref:DUF1028 domain-containing protein n=1 Tax=unclassified Vibrio TaxID=2614977 RepID=UPI001EFD5C3C|nr:MULTISPECIES: DUF1028 domain-containing protein [unclassified Vibrio]MCG9555142.1 DUF1028 domain-containing protein [Vibrio sp. Isolate32]MCG9601620.1 DUF1028 domain-containing protein [Vibrio sp. Isolate31]
MTFSVAGVCPNTGMVGCAIASSSISVASRCVFAKSKTGVVLTQNVTNPDLGPLALELLSSGKSPQNTLDLLCKSETNIKWRQLGILNNEGVGVTFSGSESLGYYSTHIGNNCISMGNLLANTEIPQVMTQAFAHSKGLLADRLMLSLEAGLNAGGEMGPIHSAGLLMCGEPQWPILDLRVDWHISPTSELRMILENYIPQMEAYIRRAIDPANAESYGVPGDE